VVADAFHDQAELDPVKPGAGRVFGSVDQVRWRARQGGQLAARAIASRYSARCHPAAMFMA
jgi:hypothetical protein